ncbi:MAG: molybdopterin-dependent oxidoreductase [Acidiphilium sp.]|nr:molybdopterin-dependent oxidoreductase [Acidiphilium sp.]MDD4936202.1 molybdopterin-dependent oxidoreductase [Acidiphilium sp.]
MPDSTMTIEGRETIRTTCPRDCYDACGIVVTKRGGKIRKVLGDAAHPVARGALCGKCALAYNGAWRDPELRLSRPLRRVGRKGEGRFEPASWDDALRDIAERLNVIRADTPSRILHTHYTGTVAMLSGWFGLRLFNAIGATEVDPDSVCNKAGHLALEWTLGDSLAGFDPRDSARAACIMVWGANPSTSAPHTDRYWLAETPARVIVVDPVRHDTAARAYLHLQPRPGTDAALAFGLMHVARREGLLDRDFIAAHVLGWEAIEPDVAAMTPDRTESLTNVPSALIEHAARLYAPGPSLLWLGQGGQRQPRGGNAFRALAALAACTGNLGTSGRGLYYMNGPASRGIDMAAVTCPELAPSGGTRSVSHLDLAEALQDPVRSGALLCWNNNIVASSPRQDRLRRALEREDLLHVCLELFATDTTAYADWVLPAASFLEFDDLVLSYFQHTVSPQVKAADPPGDARPNQEIFRRLAGAMGLHEPALHEQDRPLLDRLVAATGVAADFQALAAAGTLEAHRTPHVPFAGGRFPTPSGRVEIASKQAAAAGLPLVPVPHADLPPPTGQLRVLSPASPWTMNSSYANDALIRARLDVASVRVNPAEAQARSLRGGDRVLLRNEEGEVPMILTLDPTLPCGVALAPKGRWPAFEPAGSSGTGVNVNALYDGAHADMGESSAVHGVQAELVAAPLRSPPPAYDVAKIPA